jgi:predicted negative regulator of RcsB-dependent stress response
MPQEKVGASLTGIIVAVVVLLVLLGLLIYLAWRQENRKPKEAPQHASMYGDVPKRNRVGLDR